MDDVFSLIAFIFVILSLIGGRSAGGKQQRRGSRRGGAAPGRAPVRVPRPEAGRSSPGGVTAEAGRGGSAADMIPDDLWEVLTGERRRPVVVVEEPAAPSRAEEAWGGDALERLPAGESAPDGERAAPSTVRADEIRPLRAEPFVVSLEELPPPPETRHAAFRARIAAGAAEVAEARARGPRLPLGLSERTALQRAVVLREILGPPKGLE